MEVLCGENRSEQCPSSCRRCQVPHICIAFIRKVKQCMMNYCIIVTIVMCIYLQFLFWVLSGFLLRVVICIRFLDTLSGHLHSETFFPWVFLFSKLWLGNMCTIFLPRFDGKSKNRFHFLEGYDSSGVPVVLLFYSVFSHAFNHAWIMVRTPVCTLFWASRCCHSEFYHLLLNV